MGSMKHHIWQHHMDPSWDLGHGEFSRKRPWRGGLGDFQVFFMFEDFDDFYETGAAGAWVNFPYTG